DDAAARRANRNRFQDVDARLIRLGVDYLDLFQTGGRFELRRYVTTKGGPRSFGGLSPGHAQCLRFVSVELNRDLRRELRPRAVGAGCAWHFLGQRENLLG